MGSVGKKLRQKNLPQISQISQIKESVRKQISALNLRDLCDLREKNYAKKSPADLANLADQEINCNIISSQNLRDLWDLWEKNYAKKISPRSRKSRR